MIVVVRVGLGVTGHVIIEVRVIVVVRSGGGGVMLIPHCYRITPKSHCSTSTAATSAQLQAIRGGEPSENTLFGALKNANAATRSFHAPLPRFFIN
jgi:hypothetical protein